MYDETDSPTPSLSIHIPIAILCLSLSVFLGIQISSVNGTANIIAAQSENTRKQISELDKAQGSFSEMLKQREALVQESEQIKNQYTALLTDVLELAKTDPDTQRVVEKWKIQLQNPSNKGIPATPSNPTPNASSLPPTPRLTPTPRPNASPALTPSLRPTPPPSSTTPTNKPITIPTP